MPMPGTVFLNLPRFPRLALFTSILLLSVLALGKESRRPVKPSDLVRLVDQADRIEVYDLRDMGTTHLLFSSSKRSDLDELKAAIAVAVPPDWFLCTCMPSTQIRFLRSDKEIGSVSVYEGDIIEFARWSSHARVKDKELWFKWLDAHNITAPREAAEREERILKEEAATEERWKNAMPESLRPIWPKVVAKMMPGQTADTKDLDSALAGQFVNRQARIRALLAWFGSGAGPWSGFPMYEEVAEQMLLEYPTPELLDALHRATLNEAETEGAARLFGGWSFNSARPGDRSLIPADLKRALLAHSLKSSDHDKLDRARAAFE